MNFRISVYIGIILILIISSAEINAQMAKMDFPDLVACGCDSAYRCLSDQDYMDLVSFFAQEPKYFSPFICDSC